MAKDKDTTITDALRAAAPQPQLAAALERQAQQEQEAQRLRTLLCTWPQPDGSVKVLATVEQAMQLRQVAASVLDALAQFATVADQRRFSDTGVLASWGPFTLTYGDARAARDVLAGKIPE